MKATKPICATNRLTQGWARVAAAGGSAADGAQQQQQQQLGGPPAPPAAGAAGGDQQQQQRLSDEVVAESVLRDVSREYMALLAKISERGAAASAARPTSGGGAAGGAGAAAVRPGSPQPGAAQQVQQLSGARRADEESVLESLWRYDSKTMSVAVATAVAALGWPDALAAGKACAVCRAAAQMAETTHPEIEGMILGEMLRSAILSTVQVGAAGAAGAAGWAAAAGLGGWLLAVGGMVAAGHVHLCSYPRCSS